MEELEKDPLRPLDVAGIRRVDLARPVVREPEHLELALERRDVLRGRPRGMGSRLDRVLLGRQAERVPAHRMQNVDASHAEVSGQDVCRGVALGMADVKSCARRVREHVEHVFLRPAVGRADGLPGLVFVPEALPARFDVGVIVAEGFGYPVTAWCSSAWSASTSAVIASTIGTARGNTHGSWRPRPLMVVSS